MATARDERRASASQPPEAADDFIFQHESYDVYLDGRGALCVRIQQGAGVSRELTAFLARLRVEDTFPAGYLSGEQWRTWKRLEAEAVALAFDGHLAEADEALARSASYVSARAHQCAKTCCVLVIACAVAVPLLVGIGCTLVCGSLPTAFVQSRQTYVAQIFLNAIMAGAVGAGFSLLMRLDKFQFRFDSKFALVLQTLARLALGAIAGCIVVAAVKANVIFGAASLTEGSTVEFWFLFVLAIAAGFLERFVSVPWRPADKERKPPPEKPQPPGCGATDISILLAEIRTIKEEHVFHRRELKIWIEQLLKQCCTAPNNPDELTIASVGRVTLQDDQSDTQDAARLAAARDTALDELTKLARLDERTAAALFDQGVRNLNALANLSVSEIEQIAAAVPGCYEADLHDWKDQARNA